MPQINRKLITSIVLAPLLFLLLFALPALADDPLVGEIRMWPAENPPDGWLLCRGQEVTCSTYPDLCAMLGSTYGGDGVTNAYLPDFMGRFPVGAEDYTGFPCASGSWCYWLGEYGGEEYHTLTIPEMPSHRHQEYGATINSGGQRALAYYTSGSGNTLTINYSAYTGGGEPHNNTPLFSPVNFIIYTGITSATPTATPTNTPTNTPVSTATATATPTGTVTSIYLPQIDAYTHTLRSGNTYTVPMSTTFGQIFAVGSGLMLATVLVVVFTFRLVYRQ
jgi:microcystin-dependent protein